MVRIFYIQDIALKLRRNQTDAERHLWKILRNRNLSHKFRRQQPIDHYVVDFVCIDQKLIIELDGGQHTQEVDHARTMYLERHGFRVVRFWNDEVLNNPEGVYQVVDKLLNTPHPFAASCSRPLPQGER
jgi:very-short-patch-repair endonuclease